MLAVKCLAVSGKKQVIGAVFACEIQPLFQITPIDVKAWLPTGTILCLLPLPVMRSRALLRFQSLA
jgi:hypothetical protein